MRYLAAVAGVAVLAAVLAGCGSADVRVAKKEPRQDQYVQDNRPATQIYQENQRLRTQLAKLDQDNDGWQRAVEGRKDELKAAERNRDQIKKERDRYKKAMGKDD